MKDLIQRLEAVQCIISDSANVEEARCAHDELEEIISELHSSKNTNYYPKRIALRLEGADLVLVDIDNDYYENAIIFTIGHKNTDLPNNMINQFACSLVNKYNKKEETYHE